MILGSIPENTRVSYPIEYIPNARIPCVAGHATNVILLTCDAFGVLPPVSKLTLEQTMYHFISGYTAKVQRPCCSMSAAMPFLSPCALSHGACVMVRTSVQPSTPPEAGG